MGKKTYKDEKFCENRRIFPSSNSVCLKKGSKVKTCEFCNEPSPSFPVETQNLKKGVSFEHGKSNACGSPNMGLDDTSIGNGTPKWIKDFNDMTGDIRSHAFTFRVFVDNPKNWSIRKKIFEEAGFKVLKKGGAVPVDMVFFKGFKMWLSKKKITIYFPDWKVYWSNMAKDGFNYAISDLKVLLHEIEEILSSDIKIKGSYKFQVSRQHHALVQNSLAKQYNRDNKKLEVVKDGKVWLIVDNSEIHNIRMNDLETVDKKDANTDMDEVVKPFFNQLKDTRLMPDDILGMFKSVADIQSREASKWSQYAENINTHVGAIQELSKGVKEMSSTVNELKGVVKTQDSKPISEIKRERVKKLLSEYGW